MRAFKAINKAVVITLVIADKLKKYRGCYECLVAINSWGSVFRSIA